MTPSFLVNAVFSALRSICETLVPPMKLSPIFVSEAGMFIFFRALSLKNSSIPTDSSEFGRVTSVRATQPLKTASPSFLTPSLNVTFVSFVFFRNALRQSPALMRGCRPQ